MGLTTEEIKLIKQSWRVFRGIAPAIIGDLFYSKLFTDNPSLRKMFPKQMDEQYKKLIDMLTVIVSRLDNLDQLTSEISGMAQRHVQYGVRPAHYRLVGNALLWTLERGLGKEWNEALQTAWKNCYGILSETMINAASGGTIVNDTH